MYSMLWVESRQVNKKPFRRIGWLISSSKLHPRVTVTPLPLSYHIFTVNKGNYHWEKCEEAPAIFIVFNIKDLKKFSIFTEICSICWGLFSTNHLTISGFWKPLSILLLIQISLPIRSSKPSHPPDSPSCILSFSAVDRVAMSQWMASLNSLFSRLKNDKAWLKKH